MKPIITISDNHILKSLLTKLPQYEKTKEIGLLVNELEKAEIVADDEIEEDVIRINSYFEIEELQSGSVIKCTLTLPKLADFKEKKISVFSPLGVALIGYRQGMEIDWSLPGGQKKLRILKVTKNELVL